MKTALYRHFDEAGVLLYVGITSGLPGRNSRHKSLSHWFADVSTSTVQWLDIKQDAMAAEARAIREENPAHNRAKSSKPRAADSRDVGPLAEWVAQQCRSKKEIAGEIGVTPQYLSQLLREGEHGREPGYALAKAIESVTDGNVPVGSWSQFSEPAHARSAQ